VLVILSSWQIIGCHSHFFGRHVTHLKSEKIAGQWLGICQSAEIMSLCAKDEKSAYRENRGPSSMNTKKDGPGSANQVWQSSNFVRNATVVYINQRNMFFSSALPTRVAVRISAAMMLYSTQETCICRRSTIWLRSFGRKTRRKANDKTCPLFPKNRNKNLQGGPQ
jgi:hypothetical protein